ncbi:CobW family GTP-binding protein [Mesorhizobium sp. 113-3-3]|uniref:CobW family GTP-binding protein n=1 Tax=Mesorhizobium sp. 113-3-3 TaxID=2744516 RepID=UPI00192596DF|nr:GTP-binding protein [Mesorhizobium sp. 113-3-3]BCG79079.1 ATP-binding protein [Mesorhizobium sp. 113-3-3]
MSGTDRAIPVTVLTGFLGSGKTTVLNRLLRRPSLAGAAVIINEFGAIGLDHLLIEASEEQFTLLDNGCVCCTVRGDLVATLKALDRRSRAGEVPDLTHVVIETTGLADPAPILHTLMAEPELAGRYYVAGVVTTVDAVNGWSTLDRHAEAAKQVAVADRLLVTKTDLVLAEALSELQRRLAVLAPAARQSLAHNGEADFDILDVRHVGAAAEPDKIAAWPEMAGQECDPDCARDHAHHHGHHHAHAHHGIQSYSFVIDEPVEWAAFARWLDYVAALKGEDLLRFKGLVHVTEQPERPLVLHGVQHVFHPPVRLDAWPSADRRTRLVFIVRDIARETIARTLTKFAAIDAASIRAPDRAAA